MLPVDDTLLWVAAWFEVFSLAQLRELLNSFPWSVVITLEIPIRIYKYIKLHNIISLMCINIYIL